jgi:hypothetical protein
MSVITLCARRIVDCGVLLSFVAGSVACSAREDLAGVILDDGGNAGSTLPDSSDRGNEQGTPGPGGEDAAEADAFWVSGRRARSWPFAPARWPLEQPLAQVFGERSRVLLVGEAARAVRALSEEAADGRYGPSRNNVGVRDAVDDLYVLNFVAEGN